MPFVSDRPHVPKNSSYKMLTPSHKATLVSNLLHSSSLFEGNIAHLASLLGIDTFTSPDTPSIKIAHLASSSWIVKIASSDIPSSSKIAHLASYERLATNASFDLNAPSSSLFEFDANNLLKNSSQIEYEK